MRSMRPQLPMLPSSPKNPRFDSYVIPAEAVIQRASLAYHHEERMRRSNPLVSVIIPTYNRAHIVGEAIESVLTQDYPNKELIVVDDGSTDLSIPSLPGREGQGEGVNGDYKHIPIPHSGVSAARNAGIKRAHGDLIAFLDSDDYWLPGKLTRQTDFFRENPDIHICQTEEIWIRNGKRVNPKKIHKKHSGWIFEECIPRCIVSPSAVIIRRGVFDDIGMFDEDMPACEDYDLWLRAALKYQIITLPEPLIVKRGGHEDQLSRQPCLDRWRIYALKKLLNSNVIERGGRPKQSTYRSLIEADIRRRVDIVEKGAKKRAVLQD